MSRKRATLVTGANGVLGRELVLRLAYQGLEPVVTVDLDPPHPAIEPVVARAFIGSVLDGQLLASLLSEFQVERVLHFAAV